MFCAIATTIDHCKTEGVVDVFQVVKALRIHKPGAVLNVVRCFIKLNAELNSQYNLSNLISNHTGAVQVDS